jgi:hypothetical protein
MILEELERKKLERKKKLDQQIYELRMRKEKEKTNMAQELLKNYQGKTNMIKKEVVFSEKPIITQPSKSQSYSTTSAAEPYKNLWSVVDSRVCFHCYSHVHDMVFVRLMMISFFSYLSPPPSRLFFMSRHFFFK